ncbi:MAG: pimeloyl-ACP methyl ester esterase BioH [Betaproteobacteria bacterium]|nr:pimeloyl-ACP methyl ester esterase BioH [Betaproteobacteria bacterium]
MKLHIEIIGDGPDLALIHGWGMHGGVWDGVRDALAQRFRLHVVDLPGYGASPAIEPGTLENLARTVAAALPDKTHVCGWSLGGQVALEMARLFPERLASLVLVGTTPCFAARDDWSSAVPREVLLEFAAALEIDYEGTLKRFLALQARGDDEVKMVLKRLRDGLFAKGRPDVAVLRAGLAILLESDLRKPAVTIKTPALLLHGERDMLAPVAAAHWLAERMPAARLEIVAGAAHAPFLSHPEKFTEMMSGFLHG